MSNATKRPPREIPMSVVLANKLLTRAPMTTDECNKAIAHYLELYELLKISGPAFTPMLSIAQRYHNMAVARWRQVEMDRVAREKREEWTGPREL